jgi:hypothetical protein
MRSFQLASLLSLLLLWVAPRLSGSHPAAAPGQEPGPPAPLDEAQRRLEEAFLAQGLRVDLRAGIVAVPVEIGMREELLEYLLVAEHGASHESLLFTDVVPSALNAVLLALGAEPGRNASWIPVDPPPSPEERRAGAAVHHVTLPEGDAFYLYVAWRKGGERYFYRLEDLIGNLASGRSLERHAFVYLGSRMVTPRPGQPEAFAADLEGNLINLSYFRSGNTLLTAAVPEAVEQTIWLPNSLLLPPRGTPVHLLISSARLDCPPPRFADHLPVVSAVEPDGRGGR